MALSPGATKAVKLGGAAGILWLVYHFATGPSSSKAAATPTSPAAPGQSGGGTSASATSPAASAPADSSDTTSDDNTVSDGSAPPPTGGATYITNPDGTITSYDSNGNVISDDNGTSDSTVSDDAGDDTGGVSDDLDFS